MALNDRRQPSTRRLPDGSFTSKGQPCPTCGSRTEYLDGDHDVWRVHVVGCPNDTEQAPCAACERGDLPPHYASPRCQSGGRNHCTCDTCF